MSRTASWIELARTFAPIRDGALAEPEEGDFARAGGPLQDWSDLLRRRCVVIVGERGTGKTAELKARASALSRAGRYAFFLPVEEVAEQGVAGSTDVDDTDSFATWQNSTEPAWFFLDSVDESKLRERKLATVLRALAKELRPKLPQVHVVLSSRMSDWSAADETAAVQLEVHLTGAPLPSDRDGHAHVVGLAPLDRAQIAALAEHLGVRDVDALMDALRRGNAWTFVERPLDVEWVAKYWEARGELGSLTSLMSFNVTERLREKPARLAPLSEQAAREAASTLALVSVLSQRAAVLLPDEAPDARGADAIDPRDVLPSFDARQLRDLVGRGLFDEASYARVRIHHRAVREYLAAEALLRLRAGELSHADLKAMLFRTDGGRIVVPRHLEGVLAWVAATDSDIRRFATRVAPEHLIDDGDPAALPAHEREGILRAYADKFEGRRRTYHQFDYFALQRFACPELATSLSELLLAPDVAAHLKSTLLDIVQRGKVAMAADAALKVALSTTAPPDLRVDAIRAVREAGTTQQHAGLATFARDPARQSREILYEVLSALFPEHVSVADVVATCRDATPSTSRGPDRLARFVADELLARCNHAQFNELVDGLASVLEGQLADAAKLGAPFPAPWSVELLEDVLTHGIVTGRPAEESTARAVEAILLASENTNLVRELYRTRWSTSEVRTPVRRRLYWQQASRRQRKDGKYPRRHWDVRLPHAFELVAGDATWLEEDCRSMPHVRERLLAFNTLMWLLPRGDAGENVAAILDRVASADQDLELHLKRCRNPRFFPETRRWDLLPRVHEERAARLHKENHDSLRECSEATRAGKHFNALLHLYEVGRKGTGNHYGVFNEPQVAERYDAEVARAAVDGFRAYWRVNPAVPAHSYDKANSTPCTCLLGLVGVALDFQSTTPDAFTDADVLRALAYALWEINGLPPWVPMFAKTRPHLVREGFAPCIRADYARPVADPDFGRILSSLSYADASVQEACAPEVVALLEESDPPRPSVLSNALALVEKAHALSAHELGLLAAKRIASLPRGDERAVVWWHAWTETAPLEAVTWLVDHIADDDAAGRTFVERLASRWRDLREHRIEPGSLGKSVEALERLIPLLYRTVRLEADQELDGLYASRHYAQDLRDETIGWLNGIDGSDATEAIERLSNHPDLGPRADYLLHLSELRRASSQACAPMSVEGAIRLVRECVREPSTTADLFEIIENRLDEIIDYVTTDDFSMRSLLNRTDEPALEESVQLFLANQLRDRSRKQYSVVRENEVDRKKKPDIRALCPRFPGPVTLEAKVAQRWNLAQLEGAMELQIVQQYMKMNESAHAFYIIASSGAGKVAKGCDLSLDEIVAHLNDKVPALKTKYPRVRALTVVAIDFH